jgi:hypothetical protein
VLLLAKQLAEQKLELAEQKLETEKQKLETEKHKHRGQHFLLLVLPTHN